MGRKSRSKSLKPSPPSPPPVASEPQVLPADSPRATLLIAAALIVLTLVVYVRVRSHQFLTYDDNVYITTNGNVRSGISAASLRWALTSFTFNWHPVTWMTHLIDVELFGLDAGKHHLVNVAFHIMNVLLLFLVLQTMTRSRWRSAIVAALFAVHPLHVESVAWIAERKDVVSTFFLLLTVWLYVRWTRSRSYGTYAAMLATFILGLASKQMVVTLPFALLLLDYWPLRRLDPADRSTIAGRVVEKIPLFLLSIAGVVLAIVGQREVKAFVTTTSLPLLTRVSNAIVSYAMYVRKTFVPSPLALPYPYELPTTAVLTVSALVILGITAFVLANRERRYLFTGWFWFVGTLVPVIGFVQIGSQAMADRYTYIPHIGLLTAIVWLVADVARRWNMERVAAGLAAVVVALFAFLANGYLAQWRDSETLFRHDLAVTERNHVAHSNLGSALVEQSRFAEAAEQFRAALAIEADDANALTKLADIDLKNGNGKEAIDLLDKAAKLEPTPKIEGQLALARGELPKAIEKYRALVKDDPLLPDAHVDLAAALALAGKNEEALAEDRAALRLDPAHYDAHMNTGALLSRMGRNGEALADFQLAARARPSSPEPHVYLALLDLSMGRRADALAEARIAAETDHDASNLLLTNALHMPMKNTNLDEFIQFLSSGGQPGASR
jgi:protein O-mannosyl-transferase